MKHEPKRILSLDPASRVSGYAVMDDTGKLLDAGLLKPVKTRLPVESRVPMMLDSTIEILDEWKPEILIVEVPLKRQYTTKKQRTTSMAVWAVAAGAFWGWMWAVRHFYLPGLIVVPVSNVEWTRGSPKLMRQQKVVAMYRGYDPAKDPGLDVSDAIAMGLWYLRRYKMAQLATTMAQK